MEQMKRIGEKTVFNRILYKVIFIITTMITIVPYMHEKTGAYVKLLLAWGLVFVCKDLICTRGKIYKNRYVLTLFAFLACYGITILTQATTHRGESIKSWLYMLITFTALFVSDAENRDKLEREIKIILNTIISCTAILNLICIFTYCFQMNTSYEAEGITVYIGMYDNRLWGLYNPNVGAMLAVVSFAISIFFLLKIKSEKIKNVKVFYIVNCVIQFLMIILTGSRTVIYGTAFGIVIFIVAFYHKKGVVLRLGTAVLAGVLFVGGTVLGAPLVEKIPKLLDPFRIELPKTRGTETTTLEKISESSTTCETQEEKTTTQAKGETLTAEPEGTKQDETQKSTEAASVQNGEMSAQSEPASEETAAATSLDKAAKKESIRASKKAAKKASIKASKKAAKKESIKASKKAAKKEARREAAREKRASLNRNDTGKDSKGGFLNGRQYIWKAGLQVFSKSKLFGVTRENIYEKGVDYISELTFQRAFERGGLHNTYLTVLVSSGILGTLPMLLFFAMAIWSILSYAWKNKKVPLIYYAVSFVLFLYFMMEMFEARILYEVNVNYIIFWILMGLAVCYASMNKEKNKERKKLVEEKSDEKEKKTDEKSDVKAETDGKKRFFANTGWLVLDKVFTMVLSLVIMSITSRYLGTSNYGILNYGLSFVNIFVTVCKLGIDSILVAELVKQPEKRNEYIGTTIVLRMASGLLGIVITTVFVYVLKPGNTVMLLVSVIQAVSLLFTAFDTIDFYFQSQLASKYSAISKSVAYTFVCVVRIIFVILKLNVTWFAIATVIDALVIGIMLLYFYQKMGGGFCFRMETAHYLLKNASPFILANMMVIIYTQMDKIMVGSISNESEVGIYTAAMNIANMWVFIPNALMDSARPIIMDLKNRKDKRYEIRYVQLMSAVMWVSVAAGIFFTIFPKLCIGILYGKDFMAATTVLVILIWSRLFSLIGTVRTIWLICEEKQKYVKWFVGGGAVVNVILNACWIKTWGAAGAAVATLITEIVVALILPLCFRETRGFLKLVWESVNVKRMLQWR